MTNVVVIGGSFVGLAVAENLAKELPETHRVLLIEPHSHLHYLFALPRFSVLPGHEQKAFIPYTEAFASAGPKGRHQVVQARAESLKPNLLTLDREWSGSREIPFSHAIITTGSTLRFPGSIPSDEKLPGVGYLKNFQDRIKQSRSVVVIGGGAVGVQIAADLKELYPEKEVTLVHSRKKLMTTFDEELTGIICKRFEELGVKYILGMRATLPPIDNITGDSEPTSIELANGDRLTADLVIPATGQTPNTQFLGGLSAPEPSSTSSLINPANGFIRVRPTMQVQPQELGHIFAAGDVADTGAHKAARPGVNQAAVVARNVAAMVKGEEPRDEYDVTPAGIHLILGLNKSVVFRNPDLKNGEERPHALHQENDPIDMFIEQAWMRRGIQVNDPAQYHL